MICPRVKVALSNLQDVQIPELTNEPAPSCPFINSVPRSQPESQRGASQLPVQTEAGDRASQPDFELSEPSADVASIRSELSTVPGSYTGFANRPFPASTPNKQVMMLAASVLCTV